MRSASQAVACSLFCWVVLVATMHDPAHGEVIIREDHGGQIGHYLDYYKEVNQSGQMVVIDGNCLSACTLVLGLIPQKRICVTPKAMLGFHAAWVPDADDQPITSISGTEALWDIYPPQIHRWITRHGGLSRKMIFLYGQQLAKMYRQCLPLPPNTLAQSPTPLQITVFARPFPR